MNFPQLFTKTSYSLLKSTIMINEYVTAAKERGYRSLAITDENVLHGAVEFFQACKKHELQPIIGLELSYLSHTGETEKLLLYAKNMAGYQALVKLSSQRMVEDTPALLEEYPLPASELIAIIPAENHLDIEALEKTVKEVTAVFSENRFLGVSPAIALLPELAPVSARYDVPFVALHHVLYLEKKQAFAVEAMHHIQDGTLFSNEELVEKTGQHFLPTSEKVENWFVEHGLKAAVEQAVKIAESCQLDLPLHQKLLPHYPVPNQQTAAEYLRQQCWEQLPKRVAEPTTDYKERLAMELDVIHRMGFDDYFLIIWDVMDYAHRHHIVTGAGRGSAAGSLVAYVLAITDVDPIKYALFFERFLNPERNSMPDIDLDIPDDRRNEVLHYVKEKYGKYHVAQIATFGTMAAKMVLRDVGRVFGLSQSEATRWSKAIPNRLKITLQEAYETSKSLRELVAHDAKSRLLYQTALTLEGLPRHVSTHAGGVVISDQDLTDIIPIQNGSEDILLTQFTMTDVETVGLLKMDFLGLRNLSIIDSALRNVKKIFHEELDLKKIPLDDPKTLALFQRGETSGVFQFESAGIRNVLRRINPTSIEDIVAVNALYRPGPMQNIDHFVARKHGKEKITYPDASLEPILAGTYGVIVYQEQIMQVAAKMAGFSLGQADILRRAVSKKKKELLDEERRHFVEGALKQGHSRQNAEQVYDYIERFANYGFNRSHSFAYSFVGYQLAYLKVHYPGAFYTAILQSVRNDPKKMREYIAEAAKAGVTFLPPSINQSYYSFTLVEKQVIGFGLDAIKGIRRDFVAAILTERKNGGPFRSLDQFLLRIDPRWLKADYLTPLIVVGVFDELHSNRHQLLLELPGKIQNVQYSGGSMSLMDVMSLKEAEVAEFSLAEKLDYEEKYLGFYLSGHPTENYPRLARQQGIQTVSDLAEGARGKVLIYLKEIREIRTKKGEQMAFLTGNDQSGELSLTVFPQVYRMIRNELQVEHVYFVEGKVERSRYDDALQLLVERVEAAEKLEQELPDKTLFLRVTREKDSRELQTKLAEKLQHFSGDIPVVLYFEKDRRKIVLDKKFWIGINEELLCDLRDILGDKNVVIG